MKVESEGIIVVCTYFDMLTGLHYNWESHGLPAVQTGSMGGGSTGLLGGSTVL